MTTKPTLPELEARLRQLQLERNMGLHCHSERTADENERQILETRREIARIKGDFLSKREQAKAPRGRVRQ